MTYVISFLLGAFSAIIIFTSIIVGGGMHIAVSILACVVLNIIVAILVKQYRNKKRKKHYDMADNIWYI